MNALSALTISARLASVRLAGFFISSETAMPFIRTSVHKDTTLAQRQAIVNGIQQALIDGIGMPADEMFNMVDDYDEHKFFFNRSFSGYKRSDRVVVVEITMRRGRSDAMKRALYAKIAANLEKTPAWRRTTCSSSHTKTTTPTGRWAAASSPWPLPSRSTARPDSCVRRLPPGCHQGCSGAATFDCIEFFEGLRTDNLPAR